MKKTITQCDRCGAVYGELDYVPPVVNCHGTKESVWINWRRTNTDGYLVGDAYPSADLCPECRQSFSYWFEHPQGVLVDGVSIEHEPE